MFFALYCLDQGAKTRYLAKLGRQSKFNCQENTQKIRLKSANFVENDIFTHFLDSLCFLVQTAPHVIFATSKSYVDHPSFARPQFKSAGHP